MKEWKLRCELQTTLIVTKAFTEVKVVTEIKCLGSC